LTLFGGYVQGAFTLKCLVHLAYWIYMVYWMTFMHGGIAVLQSYTVNSCASTLYVHVVYIICKEHVSLQSHKKW